MRYLQIAYIYNKTVWKQGIDAGLKETLNNFVITKNTPKPWLFKHINFTVKQGPTHKKVAELKKIFINIHKSCQNVSIYLFPFETWKTFRLSSFSRAFTLTFLSRSIITLPAICKKTLFRIPTNKPGETVKIDKSWHTSPLEMLISLLPSVYTNTCSHLVTIPANFLEKNSRTKIRLQHSLEIWKKSKTRWFQSSIFQNQMI